MKNLSKKQIEQVKTLTPHTSTRFHGNQKKVGELLVSDLKEVVAKKWNRFAGNCVTKNGKIIYSYEFKQEKKSNIQKLRDLIKWSLECKGSNYFKILIEGNTGIYYAHPDYQHSDYNKSRIFDKNEETLKLMHLFNSIVKK